MTIIICIVFVDVIVSGICQNVMLYNKEDIDLLNSKIKNRDRMIEKQQKDNAILLDNAAELRAKIEDLENNIELLTNNLTDENKELISDSESEN